jgi:hypothetical protein
MLDRRAVRAFLIAPLAAPAAYAGGVIIIELTRGMFGDGTSVSVRSLFMLVAMVAAVGAPVAYGAALVVGLPAFLLLRRANILSRTSLLGVGAATGIAVSIVIAPGLRGELFSIPFPWWAGGLLGIASAEAFWRLLRDNQREEPFAD